MEYSNLTVVCYAPGARGNAIGRIIELSPSIHNRNTEPNLTKPDPNGTMHLLDMRFGIWPNTKDQLNLQKFCKLQGFNYSIDLELSAYATAWRDCLQQLCFSRYDSTPLMQGLQTRKIVTADHMRSQQALQLMPGCQPIAVTGDPEAALRLFWDKWLLKPPPKWHHLYAIYPNIPMLDLDIADYECIPVRAVTDKLRAEEWDHSLAKHRQWHDHHRSDPCAYRLDFETLFDPATSHDIYHEMMSALDLEPNWTAVSQFIDVYNAAQPKHLI